MWIDKNKIFNNYPNAKRTTYAVNGCFIHIGHEKGIVKNLHSHQTETEK